MRVGPLAHGLDNDKRYGDPVAQKQEDASGGRTMCNSDSIPTSSWTRFGRFGAGRKARLADHLGIFSHSTRLSPDTLLDAIESYNRWLDLTQFVATTTIQLSRGMRKALERMKLHPRETYEEVLERLLEDLRELNEETKEEIEQAVSEIKAGKYRTHDQLKAEMGF